MKILNGLSILQKAASAAMKRFPEAASSHGNGFSKGAKVENLLRIILTLQLLFETRSCVAISGVRKLFRDSTSQCSRPEGSVKLWASQTLHLFSSINQSIIILRIKSYPYERILCI
jgi:hypothetical protein